MRNYDPQIGRFTVLAPGAATSAGRYLGGAIQTSKYGEKIVKMLPHAKDFIEGAAISGPPAMTKEGVTGYIAGEIYNEAKKRR